RLDALLEHFDMLAPGHVVLEACVVDPFGPVHHIVAETLPGSLVGATEYEVSITRCQCLIRCGYPVTPARGLGFTAIAEIAGGFPGKPGYAAFADRDVDVLTLAGVL